MKFYLIVKWIKSNIIYAIILYQAVILLFSAAIILTIFDINNIPPELLMIMIFFIGTPLLLLLCNSYADKNLKIALLGVVGNGVFIALSRFFVILLMKFNLFEQLNPLTRVLLVVGYLPLVYASYKVFQNEREKQNKYCRKLVYLINACCIICVLAICLLRFTPDFTPDDIIYLGVYAAYVVEDVAIITFSVPLVFSHLPRGIRYIFAIICGYMTLCLSFDSVNLAYYTKISTSTVITSDYLFEIILIIILMILGLYSFVKDDNLKAAKIANKKLGDTRHALEDLILQIPDAVCIFLPDGTAQIANECFMSMFSITGQKDLMMLNIFQRTSSDIMKISESMEPLKQGKTIHIERHKIALHGRDGFVSFKLFPTYSMDGNIYGYVAICEDVTSWVEAEKELDQAKSMAELYVDLMAHDINNMNQVGMGYLELAMYTSGISQEQKALLAKPFESLTSSSELINKVKKLRLPQRGEDSINAVDAGHIMADAVAVHGMAAGREVSIVNNVPLGLKVMADDLLKDVFANLIGNAVKHSDGPINISLYHKPVSIDDRNYYSIYVEDNGPGVPDSLKPHIFDRLRPGRVTARGSGVGLYLTRTLVDGYGGFITIENRVAGDASLGTRFIVTLRAGDSHALTILDKEHCRPENL